ncbi:MAG: hypothetical protein II859_09550 [Bacteroidales bacterium]|nr:hypothetical protein [Bacteroidales bacterium]
MMKKTFKLLLLMLLGAAPFVFSGCGPTYTDDEILAMLVDGRWDGNMDISYTRGGITYASTGTHLQFWNDVTTTSGHGKWCNTFGENAPLTSLCYDFTWEAKDKVIYITFHTDDNAIVDKARVKIGSYVIGPDGFKGKLSTMNDSKSADFLLVHTYSPWDWEVYPIYPWDVYPFYPWYDPWYDPYYW